MAELICFSLMEIFGRCACLSGSIRADAGEPELSSGLASLAVTVSDERRPRSDSRSQETTALEVRCVVGDRWIVRYRKLVFCLLCALVFAGSVLGTSFGAFVQQQHFFSGCG